MMSYLLRSAVPARAGVAAPALSPQPLSVEEVGAGQLSRLVGLSQALDRLQIEGFRIGARRQQGLGSGQQASGERRGAGPHSLGKS
jgi:hypothetical protein